MLTASQKQQLITAMIAKGYSYLGAYNEASGVNADNYYKEYCSDPIDTFFAEWLNKGADYDKVYGNQCVDVFKYYNKEVVHGPEVSGNAIDYWTKYPTKFYTRIENSWFAIPKKGAVMIWQATKALPLGHIAICKVASWLTFTSFEQNWPVKGYYDKWGNFIGTDVCHFQTHNYLSPKVIGWLQPNF